MPVLNIIPLSIKWLDIIFSIFTQEQCSVIRSFFLKNYFYLFVLVYQTVKEEDLSSMTSKSFLCGSINKAEN